MRRPLIACAPSGLRMKSGCALLSLQHIAPLPVASMSELRERPAALPCCLQAARRAAIEAARGARRWGLVLGTLGRQVGDVHVLAQLL